MLARKGSASASASKKVLAATHMRTGEGSRAAPEQVAAGVGGGVQLASSPTSITDRSSFFPEIGYRISVTLSEGPLPPFIDRCDLDVVFTTCVATMRQLRHLAVGGKPIRNEDLTAIVDGCPHLELLDVSECAGLHVDGALRAKCARIKTLKLPPSYISGSA
uniref:Transport inhibitor response 1 domain-containing protein n=1 Tax=Oryza brachyantha TaxID=4533 RepID=J3MR30_ORYBR